MKKWNKILIVNSLLHQKLMSHHQADKTVVVGEDDSFISFVIVQQVSAAATTTAAATVPATRSTLQFFTPHLTEVLIGAKSLTEKGFFI